MPVSTTMLIPLDAVRVEQLQAHAAAHRAGVDGRCVAPCCGDRSPCWYRLNADRLLAGGRQ